MTDRLRDEKKRWRRFAAEAFLLAPAAVRARLDAELRDMLTNCVERLQARTILGFAPLPDEPAVSGFFERWLASGRFLALPEWLGGSEMRVRAVADWGRDLVPGRAGILEPKSRLPEIDPASIEAAIVPGRLFSERLDRLGRGAGCYDAFFRVWSPVKVGVAYDFQIVPELPVDDGDVGMDLVVTSTRILIKDA